MQTKKLAASRIWETEGRSIGLGPVDAVECMTSLVHHVAYCDLIKPIVPRIGSESCACCRMPFRSKFRSGSNSTQFQSFGVRLLPHLNRAASLSSAKRSQRASGPAHGFAIPCGLIKPVESH